MRNSSLSICDKIIYPGEQISLALPLPEFFSCAPLYMPIRVIHGKKPGPCLLITAALHGNELNGTEILNRLLLHPALKNLAGTLIAVPVLNIYGLINRSRFLPGGVDLDKCFPGNKNGTHAARMAHIFTSEIVDLADVCIDLQTGFINYQNLPQIYISSHDEKTKELAQIFNAPVISHTPQEKGMLKTYVIKKNKSFLLYEAGEAMRFDESAIKVGLKGIINVMRHLKMLPDKKSHKTAKHFHFFAEKNIWIRASTSGISYSEFRLGQQVKKGEVIATIKDPFATSSDVYIRSPVNAVIVGRNNLPLVHEGEALFQLAVFDTPEHAAIQLENWNTENNPISTS